MKYAGGAARTHTEPGNLSSPRMPLLRIAWLLCPGQPAKNSLMTIITATKDLEAFLKPLNKAEFVTVDTEFLRETTYWPKLCLVQVGGPDSAACIDVLHPDLDPAPLSDLLANKKVLKVFHAARQDLEIFYQLMGELPQPVFDTQVAAMVCGFGESVGYETLVNRIVKARLDKSQRFTDWSRRPLSDKQIGYALSDVTYLRTIYETLKTSIEERDRSSWLDEENTKLTDPATYRQEPREMWKRLKARSRDPKFLAILRELAAWREREAQQRDVPRQRVAKDDALLELAAHPPKSQDDLKRSRLGKSLSGGQNAPGVLAAVQAGIDTPKEDRPYMPKRDAKPAGLGSVTDLLRVLLKARAETHEVAQKLIASAADLELIAADDEADVPALTGWRRELFGDDALKLKHGGICLALTESGKKVEVIPRPNQG